VLKPGGILISTVQPPSAELAEAHGVRQQLIASAPPIGPVLAEVARLVDTGELRIEVSRILPLAEVGAAHRLIEGRHTRGKLVIQVAP
jgi:NADPH:quinone reductase-like Zn-dependent oxidoreductase